MAIKWKVNSWTQDCYQVKRVLLNAGRKIYSYYGVIHSHYNDCSTLATNENLVRNFSPENAHTEGVKPKFIRLDHGPITKPTLYSQSTTFHYASGLGGC